MSWTEFNIGGKIYCCRHLQTAVHSMDIDGIECQLHISYSNHCFTDKTESGPMLFKSQGRSWSQERYDESINLPSALISAMETQYCIPHFSGPSEQYHYTESSDYIIFFKISKPPKTSNELRIKVNSAYPIASWGRGSIPRGNPKLIKWVLSQRLKNLSVLKRKR